MRLKNIVLLIASVYLTGLEFLELQAQPLETSGLLAYYAFNGNASDATTNHFDGTIQGASFDYDRFGVPNSSLRFAGQTTSSVTLANATQSLADGLTVSIWAKFNQAWSFHSEDLMWRGAYPNQTIAINVNQDSSRYGVGKYALSFRVATSQSAAVTIESTNYLSFVDLSKWNHIVGVFTDGNINLFLNGTKVASAIAEGMLLPDTAPLVLGGSSHPVSGAYDRSIDDVRLYSRALSDSDVQQLYQHQSRVTVNVVKAVTASFLNLSLGTNYQLQVSSDLNYWTNHGSPFRATNSSMVYPQYWHVDNLGQTYFRVQAVQ